MNMSARKEGTERWSSRNFASLDVQGDVFLHKNEAEKNNLTQGKQVTFGVQVGVTSW